MLDPCPDPGDVGVAAGLARGQGLVFAGTALDPYPPALRLEAGLALPLTQPLSP